MKNCISGLIALLLWAVCSPADAQVYPSREMRVVVGLPAGSGGDVTARFYADKLAQVSNKPVTVENRPGLQPPLQLRLQDPILGGQIFGSRQ